MTKKFFEAILFDMDGLTINSEPQWLLAEQELTGEYGYQWTIEDQAYCLGGPLSKVGQYMSDLTEGAESGPYFHRRLVELMTEKVRTHAEFMPGARELIEKLAVLKMPLALVSASPRSIVDAALTHIDKFIEPMPFKITISADDVMRTKPDPEGYLLAAQIMGVTIRNSLILEDSLTGVSAARASGARVIAVPHLVKIDEDDQTRVIHSLEELSIEQLQEYYEQWF